MNIENIYKLSKANGPPSVDLRSGMIADDWGDESNAQMVITHQMPEDVTREHMDYYGSSPFGYMEDSDLIFYLYPMAKMYSEDLSLGWIDGYLYALDKRINRIIEKLSESDQRSMRNGLLWIWESGGSSNADWFQCPNLQTTIGIKVEDELDDLLTPELEETNPRAFEVGENIRNLRQNQRNKKLS